MKKEELLNLLQEIRRAEDIVYKCDGFLDRIKFPKILCPDGSSAGPSEFVFTFWADRITSGCGIKEGDLGNAFGKLGGEAAKSVCKAAVDELMRFAKKRIYDLEQELEQAGVKCD